MWSTTTGPRTLVDAEADLVRGAIGAMVDHLADELKNDSEPVSYAIDWFDQWDVEQRLWLLEKVTVAMFGLNDPPEPSAMLDAAGDAVFHQIIDLVDREIGEGAVVANQSWRSLVVAAFIEQNTSAAEIAVESNDSKAWRRVVTQVADAILGVRLYQSAEVHRDAEPQRAQKFLQRRGLPNDYLEKIPPVTNSDRAQLAIDRIQAIVSREN